ncbi:MAG: putative transposase [Acidimicrobiales bacterium]
MQPLPLVPAGSVWIANGAALYEEASGEGVVFVWGQATWSWDGSDPGARRLAAVQLVNSGMCRQREVADAFGVNETTVWRWREDYEGGGMGALLPIHHGPKGPMKLTEEKVAEIRSLRAAGKTLAEVAALTGVSTFSVRRATGAVKRGALPGLLDEGGRDADVDHNADHAGEPTAELVPLAKPEVRTTERQAARASLLAEAEPVITEGASLPLAASLLVLPALATTGLIEVATALYGAGRKVAGIRRSAFYGLRSLILCVVFSCLVGEPRAEGVTRLDPIAIGRLLGLDRAPEVKRLRFRLGELAKEHRADDLVMALAARHVDIHPEAVGLLYIDGHVRAYHGGAEVPKAHVARIRLAMPAELDTWVTDRFGDGLLVWQSAPGASLAGELALTVEKVRALLGPDAHPTLCFDRGGWSPKLFAELVVAGFDVLTYRKGKAKPEPRSAFRDYELIDDLGHHKHYLLADRQVRLPYDKNKRRFACRQIVRLDEATGHQTQIITTKDDPDPALLAHAMFSRWREENFFRYMRAHYALDALDAYETLPDDLTRLVANPARRGAARHVKEAASSIATAQTYRAQASLEGVSPNQELIDAYAAAQTELQSRKAAAKAIPAKVPLGALRPDAVRIDVERKRIMDAIRMATYNAESALARLLAPHYARAEDEARSLLREAFKTSADLEVLGTTLHVRIDPLSAPRRTRAIAGLCEELNATETIYPGTNLKLVYSVKGG